MGKLMEFYKYVFMIARCCNYYSGSTWGHKRPGGVNWHPVMIHSYYCYGFAASFGSYTQMSWDRCPEHARDLLWTWYLDFPSVFKLTRLIHM